MIIVTLIFCYSLLKAGQRKQYVLRNLESVSFEMIKREGNGRGITLTK